jgi:S1-C subfamily serine protease
MLLASTAGGLAGAVIASGALILTDRSSGSRFPPQPARQVQATRSAPAAQGDISAILAKDVPGVVAITTDGGPVLGGGGGAATGIGIDAAGVIVTNDHVVADARSINVTTSDGKKLSARVLGQDASHDLAVLRVDASNLPAVELGNSDQVQVGDDVVAIGNALDLDGGLSATRGIVSGLHRQIPTETGGQLQGLIQTDAAINPGNSGGPLVDAQGRVIGINTAIANPNTAQNVGFVIPISQAKPIIDRLRGGQ